MILMAATALYFSENSRTVRRGLLTSIFLIGASIVATFARSAWLALAAVLLVGTVLHNRKLFYRVLAVLVILLVLLLAGLPEFRDRLWSIVDLSQNQGRLTIWKTALAMVKAHPLLGVGPGLFGEMFYSFKVPGFSDAFTHAHNDLLNVAANYGVPAAAAWLGMWIAFIGGARKSYLHEQPDSDRPAVAFAALLAIAAILLAGLFQCYYTDLENNILWIFFLTMGLQACGRSNASTPMGCQA